MSQHEVNRDERLEALTSISGIPSTPDHSFCARHNRAAHRTVWRTLQYGVRPQAPTISSCVSLVHCHHITCVSLPWLWWLRRLLPA